MRISLFNLINFRPKLRKIYHERVTINLLENRVIRVCHFIIDLLNASILKEAIEKQHWERRVGIIEETRNPTQPVYSSLSRVKVEALYSIHRVYTTSIRERFHGLEVGKVVRDVDTVYSSRKRGNGLGS